MPPPRFTPRAELYDALIDWPKRLAHEGPFYREHFERHAVRRVLDAACGSGRHALLFAEWGCTVVGADTNPDMLRLAAQRGGDDPAVRWVERSFTDLVDAEPPFDAAICVGNSLALAPDGVAVQSALRALVGAVQPGGLVIVHALNLFRLSDGPLTWQTARDVVVEGRAYTLVKGVHRVGDRGYVDFAAVPRSAANRDAAPEPPMFESVPLLGLEAAVLRRYLEAAGARAVTCYGGYRGEAYDRERSVDLVVVAER